MGIYDRDYMKERAKEQRGPRQATVHSRPTRKPPHPKNLQKLFKEPGPPDLNDVFRWKYFAAMIAIIAVLYLLMSKFK